MSPNPGPTTASVRTRANQVDSGWEITGTRWTSVPTTLTLSLCWRAPEPLDPAHRHDGLSQFIVDLDSPGIEISPSAADRSPPLQRSRAGPGLRARQLVLGAPGDGWEQVTSEAVVRTQRASGSCRPSRSPRFAESLRGALTSEVVDADLERLRSDRRAPATLRQLSWRSLAPSPRGGIGTYRPRW